MEFDDYETLPTSSTATHMVAGAFAGIMEHCVSYPFDSVKTRMQMLSPNPAAQYRGVFEALYKITTHEGILRPVRGMSAVVLGAGPAHALYFSCYEKMKRVISGTEHGAGHPLAQGLAASMSTVLHDAIMNPAEVVKQRMQIYGSPYKSCMDCFHEVWKTEGFRAFYRSYTTQLMMNVPFQSIHFVTYEFLQEWTNHERTYNPKAHMLCGAVSGAVAAAVTTPLDMCKTLLNTQEHRTLRLTKQTQISGLLNAAATVYRSRGLRGYFLGMQARILFQVPSTAVVWSVYEFFKYFITQKRQYHHHHHKYKQEHTPLVAHATSMDKEFHHTTAPTPVASVSIA